jgi:hypothetical protein
MLSSYGSIYALGHKAVENIFQGNPEVTEKIDGSQISFGVIEGELSIRSKGQQLHLGADNGMFNLAVKNIEAMAGILAPNWVYRGEYLMKPKHNTLAYSRVPKDNIIIFDIEKGPGSADFLTWSYRNQEAKTIGLESVPTFFAGTTIVDMSFDRIKPLLERDSILGGVKIEGVVVKNYAQFTEDKKVAKAKYVSAEFQEKHQREWKKENPTRKDIIAELVDTYCVPARWQKSVQHLRDDGKLEGSPRDIGALIKAAQQDLAEEEADTIKEILYKHFIGQITRGSVAGLPQWYKEKLAIGEI